MENDEPYKPTFFKHLPKKWTKEAKEYFIDALYKEMTLNTAQIERFRVSKAHGCGNFSANDLQDCDTCIIHRVCIDWNIPYCSHIIPFTEADECSNLTDPELVTMFFEWMYDYQLTKSIEKGMEESNVEDDSNNWNGDNIHY